jgi:hypothetical protein
VADCQCPYCGKTVSDHFFQCPYCREDLSPRPEVRRRTAAGGLAGARHIRRGLLYMLLAAVCYYLFSGQHPVLTPPFAVEPWLTDYAIPGLFLGGLALAVYGVVRRYSG